MKKGYCIEVLLWKKFSWFTFSYRSILCIRYNSEYYVCLFDSGVRLIKNNKIKDIIYRDIRSVDPKKYLVAKIWLDCQLKNKTIIEPKGFLNEYVDLVK